MTTLQVLAVDDEIGMREGIERALADHTLRIPDIDEDIRFDMTIVETGEAAVESIEANVPDILLLDYKLPGIDGLEVLKQTVDLHGDMMTIMITAYASIETAIAATKQGAHDFLPKPFTPADLKHAVRKAATHIMLARKTRELEEEKKRIRFDFIRVLGHELKAPLNSISSYMYIFRDHTLGEEIGGYDGTMERISIRLDQMRKLISDLLDMTRIESGQKQRKVESIDLQDAVAQAVELVREDAKARAIGIEVDVPDDLGLQADSTELGMILNNLVSNAVKYNRDGGTVTVAIEAMSDGARSIRVTDTGIGMTPEEQAKLFKEFVRIRNEKTRDILGSGLGLTILKKLTQLYRGEVKVVSEADKGTTFTVTLYDAENTAVERGEGS
jgi:two-component system sensor histidine kinase/response regulator